VAVIAHGSTVCSPLPRLFDLVTVHENDPRARDALYFVMGDLLVAENGDQARQVAFGEGRYRVATLQGAALHHARDLRTLVGALFDGGAGTVTGGGRPATGLIRTGKGGRPAEPGAYWEGGLLYLQ